MKVLNKLNAPVPAWLFALWVAGSMSVVAMAAVPLYTGSLSVPAAGNITANQLSASSAVCTNGSKVFSSTCTGYTPAFAGTNFTVLPANQFAAASFTNGNCVQASSATALATVGSACPLLNANNTWTGNQTYGNGALATNVGVNLMNDTSSSGESAASVFLARDGGATQGLNINVPTGSTNGVRILVNGGTSVPFSFAASGAETALGLGTFVGLTAGTGTVKGASDGATNSYVPPGYTKAGAALASTFHIVPETCSVANTATTCTVALSGAGTNSSVSGNTGVTVTATVDTSNVNSCGTSSVQNVRISGSTITVTITAAAGANGCPVNVIYIGT